MPESPKFPHQFPGEAQDQDLKFVPEEGAGNLKDVLRQPPIGLEANVQVQTATTRAFSWLKSPTSAFTFKTLC